MKENDLNAGMQIAGNFPPVVNHATVALYDPQDGRIYHIHQTITFEGAEKPSEKQHMEEAFSLAQSAGCKIDGLKALHIGDFVPRSGYYRVDTKTMKLVETEFPKLAENQ